VDKAPLTRHRVLLGRGARDVSVVIRSRVGRGIVSTRPSHARIRQRQRCVAVVVVVVAVVVVVVVVVAVVVMDRTREDATS